MTYIYLFLFLTYELGMHMQVVATIGLNPEAPMLYHLLHLVGGCASGNQCLNDPQISCEYYND